MDLDVTPTIDVAYEQDDDVNNEDAESDTVQEPGKLYPELTDDESTHEEPEELEFQDDLEEESFARDQVIYLCYNHKIYDSLTILQHFRFRFLSLSFAIASVIMAVSVALH